MVLRHALSHRCKVEQGANSHGEKSDGYPKGYSRIAWRFLAGVVALCVCAASLRANRRGAAAIGSIAVGNHSNPAGAGSTAGVRGGGVEKPGATAAVSSQVPALEKRPPALTQSVQALTAPAEETTTAKGSAKDTETLGFLRDTTINLGLDGYYAYNFNHPVGRVTCCAPTMSSAIISV